MLAENPVAVSRDLSFVSEWSSHMLILFLLVVPRGLGCGQFCGTRQTALSDCQPLDARVHLDCVTATG